MNTILTTRADLIGTHSAGILRERLTPRQLLARSVNRGAAIFLTRRYYKIYGDDAKKKRSASVKSAVDFFPLLS